MRSKCLPGAKAVWLVSCVSWIEGSQMELRYLSHLPIVKFLPMCSESLPANPSALLINRSRIACSHLDH